MVEQNGQQIGDTRWRPWIPVRYNPVDRRLEWEVLRWQGRRGARRRRPGRTTNYQTLPMQLLILHPGELYRTRGSRYGQRSRSPGT